jgi:hypothetical protein
MAASRLENGAWKPYFDHVSKLLDGKRAEVEVASLNLGDLVQFAQCRRHRKLPEKVFDAREPARLGQVTHGVILHHIIASHNRSPLQSLSRSRTGGILDRV